MNAERGRVNLLQNTEFQSLVSTGHGEQGHTSNDSQAVYCLDTGPSQITLYGHQKQALQQASRLPKILILVLRWDMNCAASQHNACIAVLSSSWVQGVTFKLAFPCMNKVQLTS